MLFVCVGAVGDQIRIGVTEHGISAPRFCAFFRQRGGYRSWQSRQKPAVIKLRSCVSPPREYRAEGLRRFN